MVVVSYAADEWCCKGFVAVSVECRRRRDSSFMSSRHQHLSHLTISTLYTTQSAIGSILVR